MTWTLPKPSEHTAQLYECVNDYPIRAFQISGRNNRHSQEAVLRDVYRVTKKLLAEGAIVAPPQISVDCDGWSAMVYAWRTE